MKFPIILLILAISLAACGKEKESPQPPDEPQSTEGQILKSVKDNADAANERIRKIQENINSIPQ